ncbi:MAG: TauD/TfdA family dioxygenase [Burkholderiales bacterium]|jgi:taurine dioxygenase|nr:TauD/TfdA family dioxygenase [Burkholderiales bacterium]
MNSLTANKIKATTMGQVVKINDIKAITPNEIKAIQNCVITHGVCVIKQPNLSVHDLNKFSSLFGENINLPTFMTYDNRVENEPCVVRISNIDKNGVLIDNFKGAEYWHQDGDYYPDKKKQVWNFLYAVITPKTGGATGFSDGQRVLATLPQELLQKIEKLQISISLDDVPDFKKFKANSPNQNTSSCVYHNMVQQLDYTKTKSLYLGGLNITKVIGYNPQQSNQLIEELSTYLFAADNLYIHNWEPGDLLIWDNTLVYHRSMGGYGNEKRLLYRIQTWVFQ